MLDIKAHYSLESLEKIISREKYVDFLYEHLDRFRDSREAINECIDYAFSEDKGKGGFIITAVLDDKIVGALIMNFTGMKYFIPENLLVYIAVDSNQRGQGIGKKILDFTKNICEGEIKLHVEYDNPAKRLYEREGFTSKYAEMRFKGK